MLKQFKERRGQLQGYTSAALPLLLIGGWFYPPLGFFLLLCMVGVVSLAVSKGRSWCNWLCPRGSFYDIFLKKFSRNAQIPAFIKTKVFRTCILLILLTVLGLQVYSAWGDPKAVAMAFVRLLAVTTTAGIVLGAVFHQRAWCHICPMGTLGNWLSRGTKTLQVSGQCKECKVCSKVCPMQLKPFEFKSGMISNGDCIKCSTCVVACPANAIGFNEPLKKAA